MSFSQSASPLLRSLSRQYAIAQWEYCQNPDEPIDLNIAIASLHEYLQTFESPVHLVGHGIASLVGWLYARQYPERVRSLMAESARQALFPLHAVATS